MKTLFVPTDLSTHAHNALRYALYLGRDWGAEKVVLYHHNPQVYTGDIPVLYTEDLDAINKELQEFLQKDVVSLTRNQENEPPIPSIEVKVNTGSGSIPAIIEEAREAKADLIVMGSHGKTGLTRLVFGSVTAGVMESSSVPVLAVPEGYRYKSVDCISYASSLAHFQSELHKVKRFIGARKLDLEVVHMHYPYSNKEHLASARHLLKTEADARVHLEVQESSPEIRLIDSLLLHCRKTNPDWLVMFPERRDWYEKLLLSSKTLELVSNFRRPLLVLHRGGNG
jgi:nucleotide-binding universal stress UspA family protein